jgi:hypothetical protein
MIKTNMGTSDRNKPDWVPEPPFDAARERQKEWVRKGLEGGKDPAWVAGLVLDAITNGWFHVPTHPEFALTAVQRRVDWMRADIDAAGVHHGVASTAAAG